MVSYPHAEQLAELHRQDLLAEAASARLARAARGHRRPGLAAFVAALSARVGRPAVVRGAERPARIGSSLNIH